MLVDDGNAGIALEQQVGVEHLEQRRCQVPGVRCQGAATIVILTLSTVHSLERREIMKSFRELRVWQKAIDLVEEIYLRTQKFPREENSCSTFNLAKRNYCFG